MNPQQTQLMYQGNLQNIEKGRTNRSFKTATLRLMAVDVIANQTSYTKESILKALPTLRNIPIVGLLKGEDFGGHEAQMVFDEEVGLKTVYNTVPFGLIPESANFWFDTVKVDGKEQEFLYVDVLLWKRQKEVKTLMKRKQFSTSMEVTILNAHKDRSGVLHIEDFFFTAVCVLGSQITPAFKGAQIQTYSENTETQEKINQMMMEFAEQLGGENMAEQTTLTPETTEVETTEVETVEVEATEVAEGVVETIETPTDEVVETTEPSETYEKEEEEKEEADSDSEKEEVKEDVETDSETEETKEEEKEADSDKEEEKEEKSTSNQDYEALKVEYQGMVEALMAKNQEMSDLQASYETLQQEVVELRTFKEEILIERRLVAETQLFERFVALEETPEFDELKSNAKNYSLEDLETQLYALMGKKLYAEQKSVVKPTTTHVAYEATYQASTSNDSVFGLLDLYLKK